MNLIASQCTQGSPKVNFNHLVANMNTSVFGHPVHNSSSHALKELFGVKQSKEMSESMMFEDANKPRVMDFRQGSACESQSRDNKLIHTHSHKSRDQVRYMQ